MADTNRLKPTPRAFWLFALAIALLPIGLGGNRPLPFGLAQALLAFCAGLLVLDKKTLGEVYVFTRIKVALGLLFAVMLWAWLQTSSIFPSAWDHPIWREAAATLHTPVQGSIAISPDDAISGLSRLFTYIGCGILAFIFGQSSDRARKLLKIVWYSGCAICAYGLLVYLTGNHTILWLEKWAYGHDLTATIVNRNHFAVYAGMVFVTGAALLMQSWRERVQKIAKPRPAALVKEWILRKGLPQAGLLLLVLICILLSHSRAGLMLTAAGFCSYLFFMQIYRKAWKSSAVIGVFAVAALAALFILAGQFSGRFAVLFHDSSSIDRFKVYTITWDAILANPWLGYGLNGFQSVFRLYQRGMLMEFNRGHSDVLESLLDLGVPMGLMLWFAVGTLMSALWHGIVTRRRNGMYPCLGLAASVIVLGHACIDFSLQIPGVVFCWLALAGTGLAQSWGQTEKQALLDERDA